ncbi:LLM class flavin-dependent oxidoreductase [Actinomadura sp. KC345]|uniref:LLM class flavin-dependent oxidoreductase n=1 Tax=Actinomadura sp. KC345 TaxID=2530371 RepID=UPI0010471B41|nr:LLM class flavin-dependent oxidoreductase [Actinomadura sp. KC345]TDC51281.1 LLM class flavin-dependent oxidoreductase [Actinomadura sp. KC345]
MPVQETDFGFGAHTGFDDLPVLLRMVRRADEDGLDVFSLSDHPYIGERLDAYAAIGFVLGSTRRISGLANVTNLPARPAPMLARTVTSLSALSEGRVVLGMGAGGLWDRIADMGVRRLSPGQAVEAFEEAIVLVKALSGGGPPVTFQGRHYQVEEIEPAPVPAPPVWTGSEGRWIGGSAGQWAEELAGAVLEHGAGGFTLFPAGDGAHSDVSLGRWAREIVPAVREAVGKEKAAR